MKSNVIYPQLHGGRYNVKTILFASPFKLIPQLILLTIPTATIDLKSIEEILTIIGCCVLSTSRYGGVSRYHGLLSSATATPTEKLLIVSSVSAYKNNKTKHVQVSRLNFCIHSHFHSNEEKCKVKSKDKVVCDKPSYVWDRGAHKHTHTHLITYESYCKLIILINDLRW